MKSSCKFVLLGLPIGNISDITDRVKEALKEGEAFLVEDTREFKKILSHLEIPLENKKIVSCFDHNALKRLDLIEEWLNQYKTVYLASEAGSPVISDPAFPVVRALIEKGVEIETYPGPTSVVSALELSGLPPIPFHFHGFLGRDKGQRKKYIQSLGGQTGTHIFFENPSRLKELVTVSSEIHPSSSMAIVREISKWYQSVYRFKGQELEQMIEDINFKGECVYLISISSEYGQANKSNQEKTISLAQACLDKGGKRKELSKLLAEILNLSSKDVYSQLE